MGCGVSKRDATDATEAKKPAANVEPSAPLTTGTGEPVATPTKTGGEPPAPGQNGNLPSGAPPAKGNDWFSDLFGFAEGSYSEARSWLRVVHGAGPDEPCVLESLANGEKYKIGVFEAPTLAELRTRGEPASLPGRLTVRNELGDVSEKQAAAENLYALFQVASQFNCLEFVAPDVTPEQGVTRYIRDKTQGPACSISCGPATVFRNYFAPQDRDGRVVARASASQEGQTGERQVDNLADFSRLVGNTPVGTLFDMTGGYSMASEDRLARLTEAIGTEPARLDELRASLRVGLHRDVQVTSSNWGKKKVTGSEHLITQVFCSACAVAYNFSTRAENWRPFASLVLEAAYEATLWAAVLNAMNHEKQKGSRRVFLTCLGGGVFGNSMDWIADAMRRAFERFKDYDLDIRIITYAGAIEPALQDLESAFPPQ